MVDLVTIRVHCYRTTPDSILVSLEDDEADEDIGVWIPRSQIESYEITAQETKYSYEAAELTIPEWLAIEKELV